MCTTKKLTTEQWYDLAQRHANGDWNADGYLESIKAVCADFEALSTPAAADAPEPVALTDAAEALREVVAAYDHHQTNVAAGLGFVSGGKLALAIEAGRAALAASQPGPVATEPEAWAVYWGLPPTRKNSVHFEKASADEVAARIKSATEVRPLYAAAPVEAQAVPESRYLIARVAPVTGSLAGAFSTDAVTIDSALRAIEYVAQHDHPGRVAVAKSMLAAAPTPSKGEA